MHRCPQCRAEVQPSDKFCGTCGADLEHRNERVPVNESESGGVCAVCGHQNADDVAFCEACGAAMSGSKRPAGAESSPRRKEPSNKRVLPGFLKSWKLTIALAAMFIVVLVLLERPKDDRHAHDPHPPGMAARITQLTTEIESLQKQVDANPDDLDATLRLANLLHDVRMLPRAIAMYEKYLTARPSDPDARVDMGICYFELGLENGSKKDEYLERAKREMQMALTYSPKHQLAYFNLGIVCLRAGDMEASNKWFKECIDIDPNSETGMRAKELYNQHQFTNKP
jgi:tetratricopeptide (TPR) repeat protein